MNNGSESKPKERNTEVPLSRLLLSRMQHMADATTSNYTADDYKAVIADALSLIADIRTQLVGIKNTVAEAHNQFRTMQDHVEKLEFALKKRALEGLTQAGEYEELSAKNKQLEAQLAMAQASRSFKIERLEALLTACPDHIRGNIGEWRALAKNNDHPLARETAYKRIKEGEALLQAIQDELKKS
jgi:hypothetical protein